MRAALRIDADAVAGRAAGTVLGNLGMDFPGNDQHRAALGAEFGAVADIGVEILAGANLPLAASAEKHAIRFQVEIARPVVAIEFLGPFAAFDIIADGLAFFVEHAGIHGEGDRCCIGRAAGGELGETAIGCAVLRPQRGRDAVLCRVSDAVFQRRPFERDAAAGRRDRRSCGGRGRLAHLRRAAADLGPHDRLAGLVLPARGEGEQACDGETLHWPNPGSCAMRAASRAAASRAPALASHSRCS